MKITLQLFILGILFSLNVFADGYYPQPSPTDQPWSITASVGNGKYQHVHSKGDAKALTRLALGNELMLSGDIALGLELGLQNGTRLQLEIPAETLALLDWLPVRANLGPMFDLLVTAKSDPLYGSSLFAQLKGGVAYRHWEVKHVPVNDISQLAGEIQAGFGYPLSALSTLNLLYQGVFGNDPHIQVNTVNKAVTMNNIPVLHAVLLGFSVNI